MAPRFLATLVGARDEEAIFYFDIVMDRLRDRDREGHVVGL